jgi:hypothetical protein
MADNAGDIVIPLHKPKIALLTLGAVVFVVSSVWMWVLASDEKLLTEIICKTVAILGISFFGMGALFGCIKLVDNKPGLIISESGIQDNSSAVSGHFIRWTEIVAIESIRVKQSKFILIFVRNPRKFMDDAKPFKRWWMARNMDVYSTPLSISPVALRCSFEELLKLIRENRRSLAP